MKKWVSGVIVGVMLASTTVVGAASQNITVQHTPQVKFKFNGTEKALPEGYTVLMHQDRTYVPARFITDNMGGTVDWDNANETVIINTGGGDTAAARVQANLLPIPSEIKQYMIDVLQVRSDLFVDDSSIQANFASVATGGTASEVNLQYSLASVNKLKARSAELQTFLRQNAIREDIISDFRIMSENINAILIAMTHEQGALLRRDANWVNEYLEMNQAIMTLSIENKLLIEKYEAQYHEAEKKIIADLQTNLK